MCSLWWFLLSILATNRSMKSWIKAVWMEEASMKVTHSWLWSSCLTIERNMLEEWEWQKEKVNVLTKEEEADQSVMDFHDEALMVYCCLSSSSLETRNLWRLTSLTEGVPPPNTQHTPPHSSPLHPSVSLLQGFLLIHANLYIYIYLWNQNSQHEL